MTNASAYDVVVGELDSAGIGASRGSLAEDILMALRAAGFTLVRRVTSEEEAANTW